MSMLSPKKLNLLSMVFALLGVLLSSYLWLVHLRGDTVICTSACNEVIHGEYGKLLGVPLGAMGAGFYSLLVLVSYLRKELFAEVKSVLLLDKLFRIVLTCGVLFTLYLRYLEFFVLHEFCQWCWSSVVIVVGLVITEVVYRKKQS